MKNHVIWYKKKKEHLCNAPFEVNFKLNAFNLLTLARDVKSQSLDCTEQAPRNQLHQTYGRTCVKMKGGDIHAHS